MFVINLHHMRRLVTLLSLCGLLLWPGAAFADSFSITMYSISGEGIGESIEQFFALERVMPLVFGECWELFMAPELVQPLAPPAAIFQ